jgi:hypothetical protein
MIQLAGKAEFATQKDLSKLTVRIDQKLQEVRQIELELGTNLWTGDLLGFKVVAVHPKITRHQPPSNTAQADATEIWLTIELTLQHPTIKDKDTGKPIEFKAQAGPRLVPKNLRAGQWTTALSFLVAFTPPAFTANELAIFKALERTVGGRWSLQAKFFFTVSTTPEFWLNVLNWAKKGKNVAVAAASMTLQAARFVLTNPIARTAVLGGFVATSIAYIVSILGKLAIGHALSTGREEAIIRNYHSGYAEQLEQAMSMAPEELNTLFHSYAGFNFKVALEEIAAVIHERNPGAYYHLRPGLSSHDVAFALALENRTRDLGRVGVLIAIGRLIHENEEGAMEWLTIQQAQHTLLPTLKNRGYKSLKQYYLDLLFKQSTAVEIGLDLHALKTTS